MSPQASDQWKPSEKSIQLLTNSSPPTRSTQVHSSRRRIEWKYPPRHYHQNVKHTTGHRSQRAVFRRTLRRRRRPMRADRSRRAPLDSRMAARCRPSPPVSHRLVCLVCAQDAPGAMSARRHSANRAARQSVSPGSRGRAKNIYSFRNRAIIARPPNQTKKNKLSLSLAYSTHTHTQAQNYRIYTHKQKIKEKRQMRRPDADECGSSCKRFALMFAFGFGCGVASPVPSDALC